MKTLGLRSRFAFQISPTALTNDPKTKILLYVRSHLLGKLVKIKACISIGVQPVIFLDGVYSAYPLNGFVLWRSSPADQIVLIKIRERQHSHYLTPLASLLLYPMLLLYMCPKSLLLHISLCHFFSTLSSFLLTPPFPCFAPLLLLFSQCSCSIP